MTFKINDIDLIKDPEEAQWVERNAIGVGGHGKPVYPPTRTFRLYWGMLPPHAYNQLYEFYTGASGVSSVTAYLPELGGTGYFQFRTFSGVAISEPEFTAFWQEHYVGVTLLLTDIVL